MTVSGLLDGTAPIVSRRRGSALRIRMGCSPARAILYKKGDDLLEREAGYTIDLYVCRLPSAAGVFVISRAPRPRVAKLMNQRMTTIRRFWKPTR